MHLLHFTSPQAPLPHGHDFDAVFRFVLRVPGDDGVVVDAELVAGGAKGLLKILNRTRTEILRNPPVVKLLHRICQLPLHGWYFITMPRPQSTMWPTFSHLLVNRVSK